MEQNRKEPSGQPKSQRANKPAKRAVPQQRRPVQRGTAGQRPTGQGAAEQNPQQKEQNPNNVVPMRRKKKKRNKSGIITLAVLLVIAIIFLFGPTVVKTITGSMSSTDILKNGVLENSFNAKAVMIRDEIVLPSSVAGTCISTYKEGEKVPKGATVATVISSDSQDMVDQIKSLNVRISQARDDIMNNADFVNEEIQNVETSISEYKKQLSALYAQGNLTEYADIYQNIAILLDQKADLKNADASTSSYLEQLLAEKRTVENALKGKMQNIVNDTSGIISYSVDGFETELSSSAIGNISPQTFEDLSKRVDEGVKVPETNQVKLVTGVNYYLMFTTKYDNISGISTGSKLDVRINEKNLVISMEVSNITLDGKNALVVLKGDQALSELTQLRKVDIDIVTEQVSGIKVPKKALMNINYVENTGRIALIQSGYVYYVDARILYMNGDYAIIENRYPDGEMTFAINDFIVIDPTKVNEGQVVG